MEPLCKGGQSRSTDETQHSGNVVGMCLWGGFVIVVLAVIWRAYV